MTNNLQVFDNGLGELRVTEKDNQVWFVAKDVCDVLEIQNTSDALKRLDEDERASFNLGRQGNANVINESGLYSLILASRKPQAKAFKKWITSEVLPSIRRDGGYMVTHEEESEEDLMARALILAQKTLQRKTEKLKQVERQLIEQAPAIEYHDKVLSIEGYATVTDTAKALGIKSAQMLNKMLLQKKIVFMSRKGDYLHTAQYNYMREQGMINYKALEKKRLQLLISETGKKEIAKLLGIIEQ
ncbi:MULTISPECIES: BRO family protein [Bacillus]|uniref:BRO family protein n=1 Tax=Bacillus TaxID=1386 RepID=UPI000BF55EA3|nr:MULTISPECIES: BRO family protein [Bacillus]HDR8064436.1 phage antirepressor KilAC domain-containing protein [Bacillus cereus]KAB2376000.1 phage repressor protein/antirepressor Ant [Bacillus sp. RM2(2019)]MCC6080156.1 phage antirepressor KilAC domain-containing protein [Bacillus thuringiensis]PEV12948.1 phage repressor protein/antirepressor Ant [Bacillus thuringiensis]PFL37344.1 phage repressor protein/antirepressor Ant [Bacillus thuringiensis]